MVVSIEIRVHPVWGVTGVQGHQKLLESIMSSWGAAIARRAKEEKRSESFFCACISAYASVFAVQTADQMLTQFVSLLSSTWQFAGRLSPMRLQSSGGATVGQEVWRNKSLKLLQYTGAFPKLEYVFFGLSSFPYRA